MAASLSSRLTAWYVFAFAFFILTAFTGMYFATGGILDYRMDLDLEEDIEEFQLMLREDGLDAVRQEIHRESQFDAPTSEFIRLMDDRGNELFSTDLSLFQDPPRGFAGTGKDTMPLETVLITAEREFLEPDGDLESASYREVIGSIGQGYIVHIGESLEEKEELLETLLISFIVTLLIVLPLSGLIGWMMVRNAARGLEEVSAIAARIQKGQLDDRVDVHFSEREIVTLAVTFNAMLDRIQILVTEMTEMTDNIAHDLKSPLSRIRIMAENVLSKEGSSEDIRVAATETIEECDRLLKMINHSLDVSEAEAGIGVSGNEDLDLAALVQEACELFQPVAEMKGIELECDAESPSPCRGNEQVLQRAISNLLDNAIKYTEQGGKVRVSLSAEDGIYGIAVSDSGVGISIEDQERVFNRFFRCDSSRSQEGCGLGLNYSRAVARSHGGDITLSSSKGEGSVFTLSLPVMAAA